MNDCLNVEVRDLLPELLAGRLDADVRAAVESHVDTCVDCREELALLRELRGVLSAAPAVDVGRVVRALPRPAVRPRRWVSWRIAAAITTIAVGGTSLLTLRSRLSAPVPSDAATTRQAPAAAPTSAERTDVPSAASTTGVATSASARRGAELPRRERTAEPAEVPHGRELSVSAGVGELSERELRTLLADIERMDAVPLAEPEPMNVSTDVPAGDVTGRR